MSKSSSITLALETAVAGGSIGLYSGGEELASLCGDESVSRAETLIPNLGSILEAASIDKKDIGCIVVSLGPGSYTGVRIGIATALGLKASLGAECLGVSVLSAMSLLANDTERCICAVPMGKADVGFQFFSRRTEAAAEPAAADREQLADLVIEGKAAAAVLHRSLFKDEKAIKVLNESGISVIDAGANLARLIAEPANAENLSADLAPIYLMNPARRNSFLPG